MIWRKIDNKIIFKLFGLILLVQFLNIKGIAQEYSKIGFDLQFFLNESQPEDIVPLLVEANTIQLEEVVNSYEGNIRLQISNLYSIELPAKNVFSFSMEESVTLIEFDNLPGRALNDTMRINTNVDSVLQGITPLTDKYTGKGVLLGVIDSGLDIVHGDFKDSSGNTRIMYIWDQGVGYDPMRKPGNYSYGVEWDSTDINSGVCTHDDNATEYGHGTMVTGAAASNANATGNFKGVAPDVNIIAVATDFNKPNWLQTLAEATDYIYKKADSLGMPCVINASVGTYRGSHDGKDIAARMIDLLIKQKNGRSFVCAAGNAGHLNFHLRQEPNNDTVFTWLESHPAMFSGLGGVYFEAWSDTNNFNQMQFAIGADRQIGNTIEFRGRTNFTGISNKVNQVTRDSIISLGGNLLAYVDYYVESNQGRYKLEVAIINPDSSTYLYRLETEGLGKLDIWSNYSIYRNSDIKVTGLPSLSQFPLMSKYSYPDSLQTMVSSFTCLPSVITVGNYINRNTYLDFNGTLQNMGATPGQISNFSSLGPNRLGILKPDISSAGDFMMSAGRIGTILQLQQTEPQKITQDGMHMRNGGTSMASPTVAGMVALYFEMCNNADYLEIKNKLILSSKQDLYTINTPNPKWGAGKADAFQFLKQSSFTPILNYGSTNFCNIDSISLSTSSAYQQYSWSTNDTTNIITVNSNGSYFAIVKNSSGCSAKTNNIILNFYKNPPKPFTTQINDTLFCSGLGSFQWFKNNSIISGANNNKLTINQTGDYYCQLTDPNTLCSSNSDTTNVIITNIKAIEQGNSIGVYPNPISVNFYITGIEDLTYSIKIFNSLSQLVHEQKVEANEMINLGHLSRGSYFLRILTKKNQYTKKINIK